MTWYYKILGGHTHVRVFMNHAKCGDLCFRNEEFAIFLSDASESNIILFGETLVTLIDEGK